MNLPDINAYIAYGKLPAKLVESVESTQTKAMDAEARHRMLLETPWLLDHYKGLHNSLQNVSDLMIDLSVQADIPCEMFAAKMRILGSQAFELKRQINNLDK
jgi:hypothetical protein